jgi:hypothetical protein
MVFIYIYFLVDGILFRSRYVKKNMNSQRCLIFATGLAELIVLQVARERTDAIVLLVASAQNYVKVVAVQMRKVVLASVVMKIQMPNLKY